MEFCQFCHRNVGILKIAERQKKKKKKTKKKKNEKKIYAQSKAKVSAFYCHKLPSHTIHLNEKL